LELLFANEITRHKQKRNLKDLEIAGSRQAIFTIVQDRWRGQVLIDENGLEPSRIIHVPNAPRGLARREKSNYLHQRLNISPKRKIVLCAGSIARWSMAAEIVAAAMDWPDDYVLVMQSHYRKEAIYSDPYLSALINQADPRKVVISFDPVPQSEYRAFVDSADIGLAFYTPVDPSFSTTYGQNVYWLGLSSGKLASYLYSGLPVIVNSAVIGPGEIVREFNCGVCLSDPRESGNAFSGIFENYGKYSSNACLCFQQALELEKYFTPVITRIDKLTH
jgi:glycosyltransferase involved in cell wall biosynthesis